MSFKESSELLHDLAGVEVSAKQVERGAEAPGAEVAVEEQRQMESKKGEMGKRGNGPPV